MPIELSRFLEMQNTKSAKAAKKRQEERDKIERDAKIPLIMHAISKHGDFTDSEKGIIFKINELVMSVDGTAEGWGGYSFDPLDYIGTSIEVFCLAKSFFKG